MKFIDEAFDRFPAHYGLDGLEQTVALMFTRNRKLARKVIAAVAYGAGTAKIREIVSAVPLTERGMMAAPEMVWMHRGIKKVFANCPSIFHEIRPTHEPGQVRAVVVDPTLTSPHSCLQTVSGHLESGRVSAGMWFNRKHPEYRVLVMPGGKPYFRYSTGCLVEFDAKRWTRGEHPYEVTDHNLWDRFIDRPVLDIRDAGSEKQSAA